MMTATTSPMLLLQPKSTPIEKKLAWTTFQQRYLHREDGYKYEWVNGTVEKTKRTMDKSQFFILNNLLNFLYQLKNKGLADGQLITEGDIFFKESHRKPDIAYLTAEQLAWTAYGENQVPLFVVEIISNTDAINRVYAKMQNYRLAGVQVVWHIFPLLHEVHVYYDGIMTICEGDAICSASPALPGFELPTSAIFEKPSRPTQ